MPITKQAIKRMKQNETAKARNKHYQSRMKSLIKLILTYMDQGEVEKAKQVLPEVVKSIDLAAKKNIIHKNNAAHKKSRVQKALNAGPVQKAEKVAKKAPKEDTKVKKSTPKKAATKKSEAKKAVKKMEKTQKKEQA